MDDADARARRIAARQHGAISHAQARAAGLTERQIFQRTASGAWRRAVVGVYIVEGSPDTWQQRAAVAGLATGGVLSHVTAAALHGLLRPSPLPHVTVAPGRSPRCRAAKVHRSAVAPLDRCRVVGLTATTASRTLVDLAAVADRPTLETCVDDALCRGLASPASVEAARQRVAVGRRGLGLLADVLAVWSPDIEPGSPAEVRLLRLLDDLGLVGVVPQLEVRDPTGAFVARLDVGVPDIRAGLDYDGVRHHGPRRWAHDEARLARLRALGWDVHPVTKADLQPGATTLAALVARWLDARSSTVRAPVNL